MEPQGLRLLPDFLSPAEEDLLLSEIRALSFDAVVMRGMTARRQTLHYGYLYGYESWKLTPGPPVPAWLEPLRARAAALLGARPDALAEVLLSEYQPGAGIGWHRDAPMFGPEVVGVSLGAGCRMRFRPASSGRTAFELDLPPRSAYVLGGEARRTWQHSIPAVKQPRWSVTFRTLRAKKLNKGA